MDNEDLAVRYVAEDGVALAELNKIATQQFGDLVKAVVDISEQTMAIGAELHSDEEAYLLARGSKQQDLWGINLYPEQYGSPQWLEFDSMINVRPAQGNRSRSVDNPESRRAIMGVVDRLVHK